MNETRASLPAGVAGSERQVTVIERAASAVRLALPLIQRLMPLLDGNIATVASSFIRPPQSLAPHSPPVNLTEIEAGLVELQANTRKVCDEVRNRFGAQQALIGEQAESLRSVEARLEQVGAAVERLATAQLKAAVAQQELMDEVRAVKLHMDSALGAARRARLLAFVTLGLLALSVALNLLAVIHPRGLHW